MSLDLTSFKQALDGIKTVKTNLTEEQLQKIVDTCSLSNESHKSTYEALWSKVIARFDEVLDKEHGDMNDVIAALTIPVESDGILNASVLANPIKVNPGRFQKRDGHMVVAKNGAYQSVPNDATDLTYIETIVSRLRPETEAVVELGCGWGRNLARIAKRSGRRDLVYIGGEQSPTGCACTKRLLDSDPEINSEVFEFDFYDPDVSFLDDYSDVVVFTCAAIEQIFLLPPDFIRSIMEGDRKVTLIFYEPFGWQRNPQLQKMAVEKCLLQFFGAVIPKDGIIYTHNFTLEPQHFFMNAACWAISCSYNVNLWSLIEDAIADGLAELSHSRFEIFGPNPFNPYSLVVLEKPRK